MNRNIFLIIFIFLNAAGLANAAYLYWQFLQHVSVGRKMICPIGANCAEVVGSKYGRTFGIKNEILGMLYYSTMALSGLVLFFYPDEFLVSGIFILSFLAALFTLYLVYLQIFVIRNYCSWCLLAALINYAIFGLTFWLV